MKGFATMNMKEYVEEQNGLEQKELQMIQ